MKQPYSKPSHFKKAHSSALQSIISFKSIDSIVIKTFVLILLLLVTKLASAAEFTTKKSGNWNDPSTWSSAPGATAIPTAADNVTVTENIVLTVATTTQNAICNTLRLEPAKSGNKSGAELIIQGVLQVVNLEQINVASKKKIPNLHISPTGHLKISGTFDMGVSSNGFVSYTFEDGSTFEYNGAGLTQQIEARFIFKNLIVSGSGSKTLNAPLVVEQNLTITGPVNVSSSPAGSPNAVHQITGNFTANAGSTYSLNATTLQITNDLINNGSIDAGSGRIIVGRNWINNANNFVSGTSTVELTGSATTQIAIGGLVATTFNNLTIAKNALLNNDITVNAGLSIISGVLNTGTGPNISDYKLLTLGPSANLLSTETNSSYIRGRLSSQRTIPASGAPQAFGNMGFTMTRNSIDPGEIRVERITGFTLTDGKEQSVPRYFNVQRVGTGNISGISLTMDFSFLPIETMPTIDDYMLVQETSPRTFTKPSFTKVNSTTVRNVNSGNFSRYTLANRMTPLPVEFTWFKAEQKAKDVILSWQTAWEQENAGFEVQVSENGKEFSKVGFVMPESHERKSLTTYSFLYREQVGAHRRYYRIAQTDKSGTVTYSKAIVLEYVALEQLSVYPNPFKNELNISLPSSETYEVILLNHLGNVVYHNPSVSGVVKETFDADLPKGVYFLKVINSKSSYSKKLIKN